MELLRLEMLLPAFALVLARVAGLVLTVPLLSSLQIPRIVLVWFVVVTSLAIFPVVGPLMPTALTLGQSVAGMAGEFVVGEVLGLGAGLIFFAVQTAGQIVSHQSGMSLGQVFNPLFDEQTTVVDEIWFFSTLMFFMALRGHVAVVQTLLSSFHQVPPMSLSIDGALGEFAIAMARSVFELALRLSGPIVVALLLASLVMGFLSKTIPQLNILTVGFSVKAGIAIVMLAITFGSTDGLLADGVLDGLDHVGALFDHAAEKVIDGG